MGIKGKERMEMERADLRGFKLAVFMVTMAALAATPFAEFAQTTVYFNVPARTSFTVTLPLSTQTNASGTTAPWSSPATADINFSLASGSASGTHIQPCLTTAFGGACQTGPLVPIFSYKNTGTVNITMWMQFNESLPTGVVVGVNSTRNTTTGDNFVVHAALYDVNNTGWAQAFSQLNTSSNQFANVTMYANFTSVYGGLYVKLLAHNSTQGTLG